MSTTVYLGQQVSTNTSMEEEIQRRIRLGWQAFGKHLERKVQYLSQTYEVLKIKNG